MVVPDTVNSRTIDDILEDGLRKGIRFLENHPDPLAEREDVRISGVDVLPIHKHLALHADIRNDVVHAIEGAQKGGFSAAGGPDERRDFVGSDVQRDIEERLKTIIEEIEMLYFDLRILRHESAFPPTTDISFGNECAGRWLRDSLREPERSRPARCHIASVGPHPHSEAEWTRCTDGRAAP
jgi:hypothetical protein